MPAVVLFLVALAVVIAESAVLGATSVEIWALQTPLVLAIYIGLARDFVSGGLVLAALFVPVEWLIGGVEGAYTLGLAVVFFALQAARSSLQPSWGLARGLVATFAALLHGGVVLVVLGATTPGDSGLASAVAWQMWIAAPVVGLGAVVAGKVFARLDDMMDRTGGRRGLEHDP